MQTTAKSITIIRYRSVILSVVVPLEILLQKAPEADRRSVFLDLADNLLRLIFRFLSKEQGPFQALT